MIRWITHNVDFKWSPNLNIKGVPLNTEEQKNTKKSKSLGPVEVDVKKNVIVDTKLDEQSVKLDERPVISRVYLNRLKKKMKLQADPTVIYSIKSYYNNFDTIIRGVLYRDLKLNSPYNTYPK